MKLLRLSLIVFLMANLNYATWAQQYGLYGSPDSLRMPQNQQTQQQPSAAVPYNNYQTPYAGQTGNAPGVYSQQVTPYSVPNGYVAPQAQYPVQPGYPQQQQVQPSQPVVNPSPNPAYRTASTQRPMYVAQQPSQAIPEPMPAFSEPVPQQNPGLTSQMLSEQGQTSYVPYNSSCGPCRTSVNQYQESACGANLECGYNACPWYASLSALALTRNNPNKVWTSNEPFPYEYFQLMNTQQAQSSWKLGGEIRFGRRFCCDSCNPCGNVSAGYWAVDATYWTTETFNGTASMRNTDPNTAQTIDSPLDFSYMQFPGAVTVTDWFNGAYEHRLWRHDEMQSVEINFIRGQWANVSDSNWDFAFSAGPRFFRFEESLRFGSLRNITVAPNATPIWGQNGGIDEAYIDDKITNNLWGGQLGLDLGYNFAGGALRLFVIPKAGVYNNNITNNFLAYRGDGAIPTIIPAGGAGTYPVNSTTNNFAVMTQFDVGAEWFFAQRWSLRAGYRLVAISGIGLADNQIPHYINDTPAIADIDANGELFLHGGFATLTFNF